MTIIRVENLGKKYTIGRDRNRGDAFKHTTFRDSVARAFRTSYQRLRHPLSPNREPTDLSEFWALRAISFEIRQGDRVGIIGRNGAGKSTLLKIISRISAPTTGRIEINGRVASLLEVGTGFHHELTGRENIYLNGAILGMTRMEVKSRFDEIVEFAEIAKFLDTPVKRYSSGMYVRLAFAVAAHLEPEILIVDEVLAVGDAAFQKKCLGKMSEFSAEGRTVLFVSHNMDAVGALCNRGILLDEGLVVADTTVGAAVQRYFGSQPRTNLFQRVVPPNETCFLTTASIKKNGQPTAALQNGDQLQLDLQVKSRKPQRVSFEIIVRDQSYRPVFFGPLGLAWSQHHNLPAETSHVRLEFDLPFLASGDYYLDILIVDAGKEIFDNNESALKFEIESAYVSESSWSFRQARGQGAILLRGTSRVLDDPP